jgi:polyhydroxyalkanoate synthesis regulator phasin
MINKKLVMGAGLSLMIILSLLVSGSVFAQGTENSGFPAKAKGIKTGLLGSKVPDKAAIQEKLKTEIAELVSGGTLTQAEADQVAAYFEKYCGPQTDGATRVNPLEQMVTDGVLTQEKADAVAKILPGMHFRGKDSAKPQADLSALVSDGTLTQAEADKVLEYLQQFRSEKKDSVDNSKINPFQQLVTAGILTQEKADAVAKVLHHKRNMPGRPLKPSTNSNQNNTGDQTL